MALITNPFQLVDVLIIVTSKSSIMKYLVILTLSVSFIFSSCTKIDSELLDEIQGEWVLDDISGGFTGAGAETSWDFVSIEDNTFELISSSDGVSAKMIIASGKIIVSNSTEDENLYDFNITETTIDDLGLEIDPEKIITIEDGKMNWISPCCDRFNYHFSKD